MVRSRSMEPSPGLARFAEVVARDDFALDHAALLIGAWDYPERDLERYREQLDGIARDVAPEVARATSGIGRARAISDCAVRSPGLLRATPSDYYDPRNSFLCDVIDRRTGIPISLSVLYLEVARRVGVLAQGVNFPGHFLVRVAIEDAWLFLDPFTRRPRAHAGRSRGAAAQDHDARRRARAERDRRGEQASDRRAHARQPRRDLRPQRRPAALARRARAPRGARAEQSAHRARSRAAPRARRSA